MDNMNMIDKQKLIFGSVFLMANRLQVIGDKYFAPDDMTVKQWFLTIMISQFNNAAPTLSEVSELMGTSHQNVKQIALKLEKKGFLSIEKDEVDGRAIRLRITEKSFSFWSSRIDKDNEFISSLFKGLDENETSVMCSGLMKLYENIQVLGKTEF